MTNDLGDLSRQRALADITQRIADGSFEVLETGEILVHWRNSKNGVTRPIDSVENQTEVRVRWDKYSLRRCDLLWSVLREPIAPGYRIWHLNRDEKDDRLENMELVTEDEYRSRRAAFGVIRRRPRDEALETAEIEKAKDAKMAAEVARSAIWAAGTGLWMTKDVALGLSSAAEGTTGWHISGNKAVTLCGQRWADWEKPNSREGVNLALSLCPDCTALYVWLTTHALPIPCRCQKRGCRYIGLYVITVPWAAEHERLVCDECHALITEKLAAYEQLEKGTLKSVIIVRFINEVLRLDDVVAPPVLQAAVPSPLPWANQPKKTGPYSENREFTVKNMHQAIEDALLLVANGTWEIQPWGQVKVLKDGQGNTITPYLLKEVITPTQVTFRLNGRYVARSILLWSVANGPIPHGMRIWHKNRDEKDDRLENMELVTDAEYHRRASVRGLDRWK